jgi:hypothetical protein
VDEELMDDVFGDGICVGALVSRSRVVADESAHWPRKAALLSRKAYLTLPDLAGSFNI